MKGTTNTDWAMQRTFDLVKQNLENTNAFVPWEELIPFMENVYNYLLSGKVPEIKDL